MKKQQTPLDDIKAVIDTAKKHGVSFSAMWMNPKTFDKFIKSKQFLEIWYEHFTKRAKFSTRNVNKVLKLHGFYKIKVIE